MDMLQHRFFGMYMPMSSEAQTNGGQVKANVDVIEGHQLRLGTDFQYYRLDDWWPPIGVPGSSMCCSDFYNIRDGRRDRLGIFGEWEARWSREWTSLFGIRTDKVISDVGNAQGYNTGWRFVGGQWVERGNAGLYYADAAAFNAKDLKREDRHFDFTTLSRYEPTAQQTYELGLARKTRSPNLYERYPWSTNAMAALMNNFVGDGNGYIGNPDLKPEIAHTLSATADWHDVTKDQWQLRATTYVTYVDNYIDARRLNKLGSAGAGCDGTNVTTTNCYVLLQYSNVDAILYGLDLSGKYRIGSIDGIGSFAVSGLASYVRGENKTTGDPLYHIMPENAKLILEHRLGTWTNSLEVQTVDAKTRVSQVRNEAKTPDYTLYHLRSSLEWKQARLDLTVENLFNEFYYLPLGGAYVAQGNAMTTNAIPWGMVVPGRGRSINVGVTYRF
jgi:iron complex outermembrane receptor protein